MRIVFMGSPEEVVAPASYLYEHGKAQGYELVGVVSQPARPVGRGGEIQDPPVAAWAKSKKLPCLQPESAKTTDFLDELRKLAPDVIVTAAYGQILSDEFLKIPARGTINIHPSRLPQYRGATPIPAALLDGLTNTAVTILFTVKKLDAGNIILVRDFKIEADETAGALTARLFAASGPMLLEALTALKDPQFTGHPQNDAEATFCKKIEKDAGEIDWSQNADQIVHRFRAFEPWPGSWTFMGERRIAITAMAFAAGGAKLDPGYFTWDKPTKSLIVCTGQGCVKITGLKPAGGKAMDAAGFWNGLKDKTLPHFHRTQVAP